MSGSPQLQLHPCAQCARIRRTCCQRAEVLVTLGDVERIRSHAKVARGAAPGEPFHERRRPVDPEYLDDDADDPLWHSATVASDGTRRVLRRRGNGDCYFLGEAGCVLPEAVRPLVCRLYPWTYTEAGLSGEDPDYCPTAELEVPAGGMARRLGIQAEIAEAWRRTLYRELRSEVTS